MKKILLKISVGLIVLGVAGLGALPQTSQAGIRDNSFNDIINPQASIQTTGTLYVRGYVYPIRELDNCSSKSACFDYCEKMENIPTCAAFSERQGIMKPGTSKIVQVLVSALISGDRPGECNTLGDCVTYCDHSEHYSDCTAYTQRLSLNSSVLGDSTSSALAQLPPGLLNYCDTQASCAVYCASSSNSDCASLPASNSANISYITPQIQALINNTTNTQSDYNPYAVYGPQVKSVQNVDENQVQQQLQNCLDAAGGTVIEGVPTTANPYPSADTTQYEQQVGQCDEQATQNLPTIADSQSNGQQQALQSVNTISDCFAQLQDFAKDYQRCLPN